MTRRWRWLCAAAAAGTLLLYCERTRVREAACELEQVVGLLTLPVRWLAS